MSAFTKPTYYFSGIGFDSSYYGNVVASGLSQATADGLYLRKTVPDTSSVLESFTAGVATGSLQALSTTGSIDIATTTTNSINIGSATSTLNLNSITNIGLLNFAQIMNFVGWGTRALSTTGQRMLYPANTPQIFYLRAGFKLINLSLSHYITAGNGGLFPIYVSMYACANNNTLPTSATLDSFAANWSASTTYVVSTTSTFNNVSFSFITDNMPDGYYYFDIKWQNPNVTNGNGQGFASLTCLSIPSTALVSGIKSTSGGP